MDEKCIKGTNSGDGRIIYEPEEVRNSNPKPLSPEEIKDLIQFQERLFDELFSDVKPGAVVTGPTEHLGLTLENIRSFNFGIYGTRIFSIIHEMVMRQGLTPQVKIQARFMILDFIDKVMTADAASQKTFSSALTGTFTVTNRDRRNREMAEIVKYYDNLTRRYGKIGITDYEIKFSYRSRNRSTDPNDIVVFIDSEGLCLPLYPIKDSDKSTLGEGIFVSKTTPESSPNEPYIVLPLPTEGEATKSDILNGVFFSSVREFKEIYKREFKVNYETSNEDERVFNIKKLVGKYLFNGITETSHGLVSMITGYSLTRKKFYTCSPEYGISEILNITPENLNDNEFTSAISEIGLTREHLSNNDFIIRKTNIGSGSGKVASQNTRTEKIRIGRKTGLNEIRNSMLDQDLALFNETGIGIFSTREAAERCLKYGGGDVEKYVQYLSEKTSSKSEKRVFIDSIKNAALVGAGAAIPKLIEYLIKNPPKKETVSMSIMKPMLPPMSVSKSLSNIARTVSGINRVFKIASITLVVWKGIKNMSFVKGVKSFFAPIFNSDSVVVKTVKKVAKVTFEMIKEIGITAWSALKFVARKIKGGIDILLSPEFKLGEKLKRLGVYIINGTKSAGMWIWNNGKRVVNFVKPYVVKGYNMVKGFFSRAWNWVRGKFSSKKENTTVEVDPTPESNESDIPEGAAPAV